MRNMLSLTFWFMWRSFVNSLKRHWKLFLGIIAFVIALVGIVLAVEHFKGGDDAEEPEQTITEEEPGDNVTSFGDIILIENENDMLVLENGKEYRLTGVFIFEAIAGLVVLILFASGIVSGAKNGVNIFSMADANFLFPSPNKPQNVLMFKMLAQIGITMVGSIYILFQMPNYINQGVLTIPGAIILFVAFIFLAVSSNYFGIFTYMLVANRTKIKRVIEKFGMALVLVPVVIVVIMRFVIGMGLFESIYSVISGSWSRSIPMVGWIRYSVVLAVEEKYLASVGVLVASAGMLALLIYVLWQFRVDFYEDALTFAAMQQDTIDKLDNKTKGGMDYSVKHDKRSDQKRWDKRRNKTVVFDGYEGGRVFFAKSVLGRRRMNGFYGLLSSVFIGNVCYGLGLILAERLLMESGMDMTAFLLAYLMIILFGLLARSFVNPIQMDLNINFIYMIPEKPLSLIGWDMLGYLLDGAVDFLPILGVAFYFTRSISFTLVCYLTILVLHFYFGMMSLMTTLVIKTYLPKYLSIIIQIVLKILPFVVAVLIIGFAADANIITGIVGPFVIFIISYLAMSLLAFWPCCACLHRGRK